MSPSGQRDPGPQVTGVAAVGLVEDLADGDVAARGDVAGVPAVHRPRPFPARAPGVRAHDLFRGPRLLRRQDVEHAAGLGHPLGAFLLPGPGPFVEGPHLLVRGPGPAAAGLGAHGHALAVRRDRQRRHHPVFLPGPGRPLLVPEPVPVEPLRIRGRRRDDLLQLPLADAHPGHGQHERMRLLIGDGPAEHLRQPLQAPGILAAAASSAPHHAGTATPPP